MEEKIQKYAKSNRYVYSSHIVCLLSVLRATATT